MANGFKNMALAGAGGVTVVAWSDARRPSRTHRRDHLAGQSPCGAVCAVRVEAYDAATTEGSGLTNLRQLKI